MFLNDLKAACLEYFVGTEHIFCVLASDDGRLQKFRLAAFADVYPLIESLTASIKIASFSGTSKGLESFSFNWGNRLLPPFEALERFDVLVVIPHYCLHQVPFQTIWIHERGQFLGEIFGLTYNPTATLFRQCINRNAVRALDLSLWQFGFRSGESTVGAPPAPKRSVGIGVDVLGGLTTEYRNLAEEFASHFAEPKTRFEATHFIMQTSRYAPFTNFRPAESVDISASRRVKDGLESEGWEAICIVCHGHHDEYNSYNSGLLLEKSKHGVWKPVDLHKRTHQLDFRDEPFCSVPFQFRTRYEAEIMTLSELSVHCRTDAQLVALYGCHTAAGEMTTAQAFNSIAYQWLKIGAASVVANLWEVDIDFLRRFSPLFLKNWLVYRQPKAIALREALRSLRDSGDTVATRQWGTVALFGDWL